VIPFLRASSFVSRTLPAGALLLALAGCGREPVGVLRVDEPFLYLVLNHRTLSTYANEPAQHALLLTSGLPTESARYRSAESFEMRRSSDDAHFGWRRYPALMSEPGTVTQISLNEANFYLPEAPHAGGLGAAALRPGETYRIRIVTEQVTLQGTTTIPEDFAATTAVRDGGGLAVWPRVRGAGGYLLGWADGTVQLQRDTVVALTSVEMNGQMLRIYALDANLYEYMADPRLNRAGIDRGLGVFGAFSATELRLVAPRP